MLTDVSVLVNEIVFNRFKWFKIKCLAACLMNLEKVKYFKEIKVRIVLKLKLLWRNKRFEESSSKSKGIFTAPASIYDRTFFLDIVNCLLLLQ